MLTRRVPVLLIRCIYGSQRSVTKFNIPAWVFKHCIDYCTLLYAFIFCGGISFSLPPINSKCAKLISLALISLVGPQFVSEKAVLNYLPCIWVFSAHGGIGCCPFFPLLYCFERLPHCRLYRDQCDHSWLMRIGYQSPTSSSSSYWYEGLTLDGSLLFCPNLVETTHAYQYLCWKLIFNIDYSIIWTTKELLMMHFNNSSGY